METYHGHVRTPHDAIILFEACRIGILPRVQRRLSEKERQQIKSGSVFVWDEREAGMRRWTDGKSWSASRVSGSFLTYREMEGKRGSNSAPTAPVAKRTSGKTPDGSANDSDEGPDGYRYKPDGLMKQSFSITTSNGQHLHLISYYSRANATNLAQPSNDAQLRHIRPPKSMYPESAVNETQNLPAVTRPPMPGSPFNAPGQSVHPPSPYTHSASGSMQPLYAMPVYPPTPPNGGPPPPMYAYHPQHPVFYGGVIYPQSPHYPPQPHVFDRPPPGMANANAPPGQAVPLHHPAYPPPAAQHAGQLAPRTSPGNESGPPITLLPANVPSPLPAAASMPEQGPQLPAINGAMAATGKPSTPEPTTKSQSHNSEPRPLPTLGQILNGEKSELDGGSNSRSGSRSPNTAARFTRDFPTDRLAHSASAADNHALNKLNSVFVRS